MASDSEKVQRRLLQDVKFVLQTNTQVKIQHHSFILDVLGACHNEMQNIHTNINEAKSTSTPRKKASARNSKRSTGSREEFLSLTDHQKNAQGVSFKIKNHFIQVVNVISGLLHRRPGSEVSDIWACYEAMFFLQTFTEIEKIYVFGYEGETKLLQMLLPTANPRNMKLRGEWVVDILDPGQAAASDELVEGASPLTRDVGVQTDLVSSDEEDGRVSGARPYRKTSQGKSRSLQAQRRVNDSGKLQPQQQTKYNTREGPVVQSPHTAKQEKQCSDARRKGTPNKVIGDDYCSGSKSLGPSDKPTSDSARHDIKNLKFSESFLTEIEHLYPILSSLAQNEEHEEEQTVATSDTPGAYTKSTKEGSGTSSDGEHDFVKLFQQSYNYLDMVLKEKLPLLRLQWLVRCLQSISDTVEREVAEATDNKQSVGADDLLPSLILFLIKGDPGKVTALYPQLKFLEDYLPDFIAAGISGFTVTQFSTAYAVIIETEDERL